MCILMTALWTNSDPVEWESLKLTHANYYNNNNNNNNNNICHICENYLHKIVYSLLKYETWLA